MSKLVNTLYIIRIQYSKYFLTYHAVCKLSFWNGEEIVEAPLSTEADLAGNEVVGEQVSLLEHQQGMGDILAAAQPLADGHFVLGGLGELLEGDQAEEDDGRRLVRVQVGDQVVQGGVCQQGHGPGSIVIIDICRPVELEHIVKLPRTSELLRNAAQHYGHVPQPGHVISSGVTQTHVLFTSSEAVNEVKAPFGSF